MATRFSSWAVIESSEQANLYWMPAENSKPCSKIRRANTGPVSQLACLCRSCSLGLKSSLIATRLAGKLLHIFENQHLGLSSVWAHYFDISSPEHCLGFPSCSLWVEGSSREGWTLCSSLLSCRCPAQGRLREYTFLLPCFPLEIPTN